MPPRPIRKIHTTPHFEKSFRKLPEATRNLAAVKDQWFRADAFDPRLKTHALKGKLKNLCSYSVDHSTRILFEFLSPDHALYHDIGSHNVYR